MLGIEESKTGISDISFVSHRYAIFGISFSKFLFNRRHCTESQLKSNLKKNLNLIFQVIKNKHGNIAI